MWTRAAWRAASGERAGAAVRQTDSVCAERAPGRRVDCSARGCVRGLREVAAGGGSASGHARGSRGAREPLGSILSPPPAPLGAQNRRAKTDAAAKGEAIES